MPNEQQLEAATREAAVAVTEVVVFLIKYQLLWPGLSPKIYVVFSSAQSCFLEKWVENKWVWNPFKMVWENNV